MFRTSLSVAAAVLLVGSAVAVAVVPAEKKPVPVAETRAAKPAAMPDPFRCVRGPFVANRNRDVFGWEPLGVTPTHAVKPFAPRGDKTPARGVAMVRR